MAFSTNDVNKTAEATTLVDVLKALKENINNTLHVSTLAFYNKTIQAYNSSKGYGIIEVLPFPLEENQTSYTLQAYYFKEITFINKQIVLVVFTDKNFASNLNYTEPKSIKEETKHRLIQGVVIPLN